MIINKELSAEDIANEGIGKVIIERREENRVINFKEPEEKEETNYYNMKCERCNSKDVKFRLSHYGGVDKTVTYIVTCRRCGHQFVH